LARAAQRRARIDRAVGCDDRTGHGRHMLPARFDRVCVDRVTAQFRQSLGQPRQAALQGI
jgi:hypothetical protein